MLRRALRRSAAAANRSGTRRAGAAAGLERRGAAGYRAWAGAIRFVLDMLRAPGGAAHRRDVQLIAALPLPARNDPALPEAAESSPLALLAQAGVSGAPLDSAAEIGSALLQLAY